MKSLVRKYISVLVCYFLFTPLVYAAGTTGANFLTLGGGARVEAMGGTGTALAIGVDAAYWNAASLGRSTTSQLSFSHAAWFADINYEHLGYVQPLGKGMSVALSSLILYTSGIARTFEDPYGIYKETDGSFSYHAMALCGSIGKHAGKGLYVGGSAKFIYENNAEETSAGAAFDLGTLYVSPDAGWSAGIAARNLGPNLKLGETAEPLPLQLALGCAAALLDSSFVASAGATFSKGAGARFALGVERGFGGVLFLRGGFTTSTEKTANRGFAAGAGISIRGFSIDYSATDLQELGLVHRFTVGTSSLGLDSKMR